MKLRRAALCRSGLRYHTRPSEHERVQRLAAAITKGAIPLRRMHWHKDKKREAKMKKMEYPVTPAVRMLRKHDIEFVPHLYAYEDHGGTRHAADSLGVAEHAVVKTLVLETDARKPLLVLMHGDCEVSTKQLARTLGVKRVEPADAARAGKYTGYQVGGISPFGTRMTLPVYVERTILALERIWINGGKRGFLVEIDPGALRTVLEAQEVVVAIPS